MKAGVFITPNHNLVYVAKDRTVKAATASPYAWLNTKVEYRRKDDTVVTLGFRCTRYADVPNGCKDHAGYLRELDADRKSVLEHVVNDSVVIESKGFNVEANLDAANRLPLSTILYAGEPIDVINQFAELQQRHGGVHDEVLMPMLPDAGTALRVQHDCFLNALLDPDAPLYDYQREAVEELKLLGDPTTVPVGLGKKAAMLRDDPYKKFADTVYRGPVLHKPRRVGSPPVLGYGYGITTKTDASRLRDLWRRRWESNLRAQGFRIVSAASARKHRKKGRTLLPLGNGRYAWRPCEATCTRYDNEENYGGL